MQVVSEGGIHVLGSLLEGLYCLHVTQLSWRRLHKEFNSAILIHAVSDDSYLGTMQDRLSSGLIKILCVRGRATIICLAPKPELLQADLASYGDPCYILL
jgi:hypothetical protein